MSSLRLTLVFAAAFLFTALARADDGYRLWLRYDPISDSALREHWSAAATEIVTRDTSSLPPWLSGSIEAARDELATGLRGMLGHEVPLAAQATRPGAIVLTTADAPGVAGLIGEADLRAAGEEGYVIRQMTIDGRPEILVVGNRLAGTLHGTFALLRHIQTGGAPENLHLVCAPKIQLRMLDHWDNLDRFVERGYAGQSLWDWFNLPDYIDPRYRDYARACASVGLNGVCLTNVNADALVLTAPWLAKVAALAGVFRPYGIRVYLTARFSAPIEIGGLKTADPLDPSVRAWWRAKADEIYRAIPDFGGFVVKANSEGQPGPQDYHRTHADGANMLADAVVTHGGVVLWRAFVYATDPAVDRVKQAYNEFQPLDGQFRSNVILQIKNGPLDVQPREPFSPLFGAMPRTPLALELQLTQEYLGGSVHLAYLGTMWQEVLDADTFAQGPGSTVARVVEGALDRHGLSAIAGVANIGTDRNWTGHPLAQANWYAFGRLAWDPELDAAKIADEWTRQTFGNDPHVVATIDAMLMASREAVVSYEMPLGLHHIMATGHHYGPGPWVDNLRADWNPVYYHRADATGLGFDRTKTGSDALAQYAPELARRWGDIATCPENLLLWFHHVPWDRHIRFGRTLWEELCLNYQRGVDEVRKLRHEWDSLAGSIDAERFAHVQALLARQEREACEWRDACLLYFQTFSKRPLPAGVEPPTHSLDYYESIQRHHMPGDPAGR